jgi:hypothetical protein
MFLLNASNWPPARQPLALTSSSNALSATLTVPAYSVVALSVPAQPAVPDFSTAVTPQSASIKAGQKAQFTLTVAPMDRFSEPVSLSCTGAPQNATCSLSSQSVTLDGTNPANVTVTVTTQAATAAAAIIPLNASPWLALGALGLFTMAGLGFRNRTRGRQVGFAAATLALTLLISCGGGGSSSSGGGSNNLPPNSNGTLPGTYTLTVTGTSGSISHSTPIAVTVKP